MEGFFKVTDDNNRVVIKQIRNFITAITEKPTPLMLWDILALAGAPNDEVAMVLIMDMLMIGFGRAGAQTPDQNKWFFFIFGMVTFIHIVGVLLKYSKVNKYGEEARSLYNKVAWMTIILWTLYPVVWIIAEGQRMVSA